MDKLTGDPQGIEVLRQLAKTHKPFLKHLIEEARSNSDHRATFRADDGTRYALVIHLDTGQLEIVAAPE